MSTSAAANQVLALCGGIGGAKLALGLSRVFGAGLTVVVNTGDDFEHLGLSISPDLDTVLYTLGGLADSERGWGRSDETWNFMAALQEFGAETWFSLGDRDLALHISRTEWLRAGKSLSSFAAHTAHQFDIAANIVPMSDNPVRTFVVTDDGDLPFQHYFVRGRCASCVRAIRYVGAGAAAPAPGLINLIAGPSLRAIMICPSNPYLSVDPILSVPGIASSLAVARAPVVAVSPIIGGKAVKGPTAKIMAELGIAVTNESIAAHYCGLIDGIVIDEADAAECGRLNIPVLVTRTMMRDLADRERLANEVVTFAETLVRAPKTVQAMGRR